MSRRYETANIIEQGIYDLIEVSERHSGALKLADKIIALDKPTGVEKVEKCTCNLAYNDNKFREECECSGSGELVTELTPDECVKVLKEILNHDHVTLISYDENGKLYFKLPDGSRLRVKE